jgi:hypothetical protein
VCGAFLLTVACERKGRLGKRSKERAKGVQNKLPPKMAPCHIEENSRCSKVTITFPCPSPLKCVINWKDIFLTVRASCKR